MIATEYFNVLVMGGATELVRRPGPVCVCVCGVRVRGGARWVT